MNVEKMAARLKRRMVFWRLVGDLFDIPEYFFRFLADRFQGFSRTLFYLELDAARQYKALTGVDLGVAVGEENRYAGASARAAEEAEAEIFGTEDDDDD